MRPLILILAVALTIVVGLVTLRFTRQPSSEFEVYAQPTGPSSLRPLWPVPDFSLTERSGAPVTLADLKGKVWVADFFYTTCPGPCPMLTSRLSEVHKKLSGDDEARLVSISSDPEKDTPEVLREYAQHFAASERWLFLTGPKTAVYQLANEGFKLGLAEVAGAKDPISHSTKLALVDKRGMVRGVYDGVGGDDTARLLDDIHRLEKEKP